MTGQQMIWFLREYKVSGNLEFACMAAGVSRQQAFDARDAFSEFEQMWRVAGNQALALALDRAR